MIRFTKNPFVVKKIEVKKEVVSFFFFPWKSVDLFYVLLQSLVFSCKLTVGSSLMCMAVYTDPEGERKYLPQYFKFVASNPLSVRTKVLLAL